MSCTNVGSLTADCSLNGIATRCDGGKCYAKDGTTDLCQVFNNPCGQTQPATPSLSCNKPCSLKFVLDGIRGSATSNMVNVNVDHVGGGRASDAIQDKLETARLVTRQRWGGGLGLPTGVVEHLA